MRTPRAVPDHVNSLDELGADGLTYRQQAFVEHYLGAARLNATEAASMAGYAGERNTLGSVGTKLLLNGVIASRVRARLGQLGASKDAILARILMFASSTPADCFDTITVMPRPGSAAEPYERVVFSLERAAQTGGIALIRKYKETDSGPQVEFVDPKPYLDIVARHLGIIGDDAAARGAAANPVGGGPMTREQMLAYLTEQGYKPGDVLKPQPAPAAVEAKQ